jgi:hypothetical protein
MKCIIAGSRTIKDYRVVRQAIKQSGWGTEITEVVSGTSEEDVEAARFDDRKLNVDVLGAQLAMLEDIPVKYFPADWDNLSAPGAVIRYRKDGTLYNSKAGPDRNERMAAYGDRLILIWIGDPKKSKGRADMLRRAKAHGLRIYEHIVKTAATELRGQHDGPGARARRCNP